MILCVVTTHKANVEHIWVAEGFISLVELGDVSCCVLLWIIREHTVSLLLLFFTLC